MTAFAAVMHAPTIAANSSNSAVRSAVSAPAAQADLVLEGVSKFYDSVAAVRDMSLSAERGEFIAFLGPSGCGKSTTLAMIAGFQDVSSGAISIRGRRVEGLPPEKRNTGMVFQNYALFPHMSLAENVGFGLRMRRVSKHEIRTRVQGALALVRMDHLADRRPAQLSGGQQQRVALARALVIQPDILLLDEPLGALDRQLREQMQLEIKALQQSVGITTIFVTHDQEEALSMSERIVVMNAGAIEQIGTPSEIYDRPRTKFVAQFIGKSNVVEGRVASVGGARLTIDTPLGMLSAAGSGCAVGDAVELLIRPEKIRVAPTSASERYPTVRGMVRQVVFHGSSTEIHVLVGDKVSLLVTRANERSDQQVQDVRVGAEIQITWPEKEAAAFCNGRRCDYE